MRKKITAKDRALEDSHSWGGVGAEREGIQGKGSSQRGGGWSPIFSLFSSAAPPLLLPLLPRS